MMRAFFLVFVPMAALTACHECSTETCTDYASVAINTIDGTWVDGEYSLKLESGDATTGGGSSTGGTSFGGARASGGASMGGATSGGTSGSGGAVYSCTFTTPNDAPDETGARRPIDCTPTIEAFLVPFCDWYEVGGDTCDPLPGKFYLEARAPGTPKNVHVVLTRGDETVLDRARNTPQYGIVQPNGSECGPTCQQCKMGFTIPP